MNTFNVASPTDIRAAAVKSLLQNVYSVLWFVENICREFVFYWYFKQKQTYLHVFNVIQRSDYLLLYLKIECMNGWNSFSDRAHLYKCYVLVCFKSGFCSNTLFFLCELQTEFFFLFEKNQTCFCPFMYVVSILQLCFLKYSIWGFTTKNSKYSKLESCRIACWIFHLHAIQHVQTVCNETEFD